MTPLTFRQAHGDPTGWCGAEIDEYLAACDQVTDTRERLERAASVLQTGGTAADAIAAFRAGSAAHTDHAEEVAT